MIMLSGDWLVDGGNTGSWWSEVMRMMAWTTLQVISWYSTELLYNRCTIPRLPLYGNLLSVDHPRPDCYTNDKNNTLLR